MTDMTKRTPEPDPEDMRTDLLATLAASRELGPEMDKALVDSYMQRHQAELSGKKTAVARQEGNTQPVVYEGARYIGPVLGIAAYIVLLIVSGGHLWWTFWVPMVLVGWWQGQTGWSGRHEHRQVRREARWRAREARWRAREARFDYMSGRRARPELEERTTPPPASEPPTQGRAPDARMDDETR